jgi:hypothetical protein
VRRLLIDLLALGLLVAPLELNLLPASSGLLVLLSIPVIVGFSRGFAERRFLGNVPYWITAVEWSTIVFASDIILCLPNRHSNPHDKFINVFAAFFIILIIPSVILSVVSHALGTRFAATRPGGTHGSNV